MLKLINDVKAWCFVFGVTVGANLGCTKKLLNFSQVFRIFQKEREANLARFDTGQRVLEGLVDTLIEHIADVLEKTGAALDSISHDIFRRRGAPADSATKPAADAEKPRDLEEALRRLGRCSDLISRLRESLGGLRRMLSFFTSVQANLPPEVTEHGLGLRRHDPVHRAEHDRVVDLPDDDRERRRGEDRADRPGDRPGA